MADYIDIEIEEHDGKPEIAISTEGDRGAANVGRYITRPDGTSFVRIWRGSIDRL